MAAEDPGHTPFVLTQRHRDEYATLGCERALPFSPCFLSPAPSPPPLSPTTPPAPSSDTVFESILRPTLIAELREACEELRDEARRQGGPQAQRLTKIIGTSVDPAPFLKYQEDPDIAAAFKGLIGPECRHGVHLFWTPEQELYHAGHGVMIEPTERPYCTVWHRSVDPPHPRPARLEPC